MAIPVREGLMVASRRRGRRWRRGQVLLEAQVVVRVSLALVFWVCHLLWGDAEDDAEGLENSVDTAGEALEVTQLLQG
jgi:hypothetical protein